MTRRLQRVWACFQRHKVIIYDRSGMHLRLKVRMLKADVIETLLYGCASWCPNKPDYDRLRQIHHSMLLPYLGWRKPKRDDNTLTYADALAKQTPGAFRRECGNEGYCLPNSLRVRGGSVCLGG